MRLDSFPAGVRAGAPASAALRALSARLGHLFATGGLDLTGDPARCAKSRAARALSRRLAARDRNREGR